MDDIKVFEAAGEPDLLSPVEAARAIRAPTHRMTGWRMTGEGPRFLKIGGRVFYRRSDQVEWLRSRERLCTQCVEVGGVRQCVACGADLEDLRAIVRWALTRMRAEAA
jgi:hypothetical protein